MNSLINGNLQGIIRFSSPVENLVVLKNAGFPSLLAENSLHRRTGNLLQQNREKQADNRITAAIEQKVRNVRF